MKVSAVAVTLLVLLTLGKGDCSALEESDLDQNYSTIQADTVAGLFSESDSVPCIVAEVHGLQVPGSDPPPKQYACSADTGDLLFFDSDASMILGDDFEPGHTKLTLSIAAMTTSGLIGVQEAMLNDGSAIVSNDHERKSRRLTTTGTKKVLVVRVNGSHSPSQSEAQLYDDVFNDDNNLKKRYSECSDGKLNFAPATGTNVNNGVMTVTTTKSLSGMQWRDCGTIALNGARFIQRDFTMIVCPNVVNFGTAAAYGLMPGDTTWYRSQYASIPLVQVHEIGHNLGHPHSGDSVTYDDYTCNMGNKGNWNEEGSKFCFNGVKTWRNGWHSDYHRLLDPTTSTYGGTLYGINAVNDKVIPTGSDAVIKLSSNSMNNDLYIMFNRQDGPNIGAPRYGNQVIVHTQNKSDQFASSKILAELSAGATYTYGNWGNAGTLTVKVCKIDTGSPGFAQVLVYATGTGTPSCADIAVDNFCQDNKSKFNFGKKKKNCKFISRNKTWKRCRKGNTSNECPGTCGISCTCFNTPGFFKVWKNSRSCEWAEENSAVRCEQNAVRSNCPKSCGVC